MKKKVLILTLLLFATGLFWHCSEEIHDNAVTFGVKHKKPQIKYLKGAEAKLVMNQLEKKVSKSKLRILGKAGTYARSNEGTIDYSEIMQVIDTLGNTNYTFRITNHPEDSDQIFHNLVYSQIDEEIKLILVKYENFDQDYQFNAFTTFTTYSLISDDPCPENPMPISGGGGGVGSFDPGIPNPGSGGGGGSVGGYTPTPDYSSCWYLMQIPCCHGVHFGETSSCKCNEGEKGYTILFNTCNTSLPPAIIHSGKNTNIDPCNPDGDFGVLYPPVKPPCEVLKDVLKPEKTNILPKINELATKTNLPDEQGYVFKMLMDADDNEDYQPPIAVQGNGLSISFDLNNFTYGTIHTHPTSGYDMFSFEDIELLNDTYKTVTGSTRKNMAFTSIVCSNGAVYTIMVDDPTQLSSLINAYKNPPITMQETEKQQYERIEKEFQEKFKSEPNLEKVFLELTKFFGIKLFKLNNAKDGWNQLVLSEPTSQVIIPQVISNPCN